VDAFSAAPFGGNPAVVCVLRHELHTNTLQSIAREFNVSETVFIARRFNDYEIRWFTPTVEVDLVGHATLAAAYVIIQELEPCRGDIVFHSRRSGALRAYGDPTSLCIALPADRLVSCEAPTALSAGLRAAPVRVLKGRHYVAVMSSPAEVQSLDPQFCELLKLDRPTIVVTAPADDVDYVLRFFAPANGVPEDPVSGVAQCSLVPLWAQEKKRLRLRSRQLSARGVVMDCELQGDQVILKGACAVIARGHLDRTFIVGE
jgi:predicted PhzF superfamily epimerase YddE/YHI9